MDFFYQPVWEDGQSAVHASVGVVECLQLQVIVILVIVGRSNSVKLYVLSGTGSGKAKQERIIR